MHLCTRPYMQSFIWSASIHVLLDVGDARSITGMKFTLHLCFEHNSDLSITMFVHVSHVN